MNRKHDRKEVRRRKRARVRKKILGTNERPRLCVFRSLRYTYAQFVSDESGEVLGALSSRDFDPGEKSRSSVESAKLLGMKMAELAKERKIEQIIFDRSGYQYHGRVAAVAEGAREGGLKF